MGRVLKVTTPFGIRQKILTPKEIADGPPGTKSVQPLGDPITPRMLRNLYINLAVQSIKGPNAEQRVSMLLNRDVATNVGAQEVYMGTPGQYKQAAVQDLDQISSKSWGLFSLRTPEAKGFFTDESKIRNPKEFIFGTNTIDPATNKFMPDEVSYMSRVDEGFAQFEPKNIGIQNTGISFDALTLQEEEKVNQVPQQEPPKKITGYDGLSEDMKNILSKMTKGGGKVLKTVIPPVAAIGAYSTGRQQGLSVGKSAALAATELVSPISPIDVYEGQKAVKEVGGFMEEKVEPKIQEGLKGFAQGFLGNLNLNINQ